MPTRLTHTAAGMSFDVPRRRLLDWDIFHGAQYVATRRAKTAKGAIAALRCDRARGVVQPFPEPVYASPATLQLF